MTLVLRALLDRSFFAAWVLLLVVAFALPTASAIPTPTVSDPPSGSGACVAEGVSFCAFAVDGGACSSLDDGGDCLILVTNAGTGVCRSPSPRDGCWILVGSPGCLAQSSGRLAVACGGCEFYESPGVGCYNPQVGGACGNLVLGCTNEGHALCPISMNSYYCPVSVGGYCWASNVGIECYMGQPCDVWIYLGCTHV